MDFKLAKMTVIDGKPNLAGNRLIASFDLHMAGIRVAGCVLVEKADGTLNANGPRGKTARGITIRTSIEDEELRQEITDRAALLYEGSTGRVVLAD